MVSVVYCGAVRFTAQVGSDTAAGGWNGPMSTKVRNGMVIVRSVQSHRLAGESVGDNAVLAAASLNGILLLSGISCATKRVLQ